MTAAARGPALLIQVDGLICDSRHRQHLAGMPKFWWPSHLLKDMPVDGAIDFLADLSESFDLVYLFTRPHKTLKTCCDWLGLEGFPGGLVLIGETIADRIRTVTDAKDDFGYGIELAIGASKDDAKVLKRLGVISLIVDGVETDFGKLRRQIERRHGGSLPKKAPQPRAVCACCGEEFPVGGFGHLDFYRSPRRRTSD